MGGSTAEPVQGRIRVGRGAVAILQKKGEEGFRRRVLLLGRAADRSQRRVIRASVEPGNGKPVERFRMAGRGSSSPPVESDRCIAGDAEPLVMEFAEVDLCLGRSLLCGCTVRPSRLLVPVACCCRIASDKLERASIGRRKRARAEDVGKTVHSPRVSVPGGPPVLEQGFLVLSVGFVRLRAFIRHMGGRIRAPSSDHRSDQSDAGCPPSKSPQGPDA